TEYPIGCSKSTKGPGKKKFHILLVFWIVYCVTYTDTNLYMRRRMCIVDEPKYRAILWNYFLPQP
ncbi:MAG: hypothetical protein AB1Z18_15285, partial [Desulfobacterales bacterium]